MSDHVFEEAGTDYGKCSSALSQTRAQHWRPAALAEAARLPDASFVPWAELWSAPLLPAGSDDADEDFASLPVPQPTAMLDASAIEGAAYARGLAEGRRLAAEMVTIERAELARLAEALETLRPEPSVALGGLLAEAVERLVRQIVGDVAMDGDRLATRAADLAALVTDAIRPARLRVAPDDHVRLADAALPVELVADPTLSPGSLVLETADGWIEDGLAVALDRLRAALDRMGVPR